MKVSKYPGIIKWCYANGITQTKLAEMIGMNYKVMQNRFHGNSKLTLDEALHICEVTGMTIDDFF